MSEFDTDGSDKTRSNVAGGRRPLVIATRASPLAMVQARWVKKQLQRAWPRLSFRLLPLTASADVDLQTPLYGMGGVGVFSTVVHQAIVDGRADLGVHSCKDLPTTPPNGMTVPVLPRRADPRDCLVGAPSLAALPSDAVLGSSSLRRRQQLLRHGPAWRMVDLRGNVQTRLQKIADGHASATILAAAGLRRLGLMQQTRATPLDPVTELVPAPAQGALAIDCRSDDALVRQVISVLADHDTTLAVLAERAVLAGLRGGCSLPLGCLVWRQGTQWHAAARLDHGEAYDPATVAQAPATVRYSGPYGGLVEHLLSQLAR